MISTTDDMKRVGFIIFKETVQISRVYSLMQFPKQSSVVLMLGTGGY